MKICSDQVTFDVDQACSCEEDYPVRLQDIVSNMTISIFQSMTAYGRFGARSARRR
jgi:hypothetical protein